MDNAMDALNYEFKYKMFKARASLANLEVPEDRDRSMRWLEKLSEMRSDIQEMKTRNSLLDTLVYQIKRGSFSQPFNEDPPSSPLSPTASSMITTTLGDNYGDRINSDREEPFINQFSPDGGAFLTTQPVPRCGAFCYMAVTGREMKD